MIASEIKKMNICWASYTIYLSFSVMARQLDRRTAGYLTWKAGHSSAVHTMVVHDTQKGHCVTGVQVHHHFRITKSLCRISFQEFLFST